MPEVSSLSACACLVAHYIQHVIHFRLLLLSLGFNFVVVVVAVFFFSTDVFQCDGCLLCRGSWLGCAVVPVLGALFQSRGWLPKVEAPGYSRHPTSSLAVQLLMH